MAARNDLIAAGTPHQKAAAGGATDGKVTSYAGVLAGTVAFVSGPTWDTQVCGPAKGGASAPPARGSRGEGKGAVQRERRVPFRTSTKPDNSPPPPTCILCAPRLCLPLLCTHPPARPPRTVRRRCRSSGRRRCSRTRSRTVASPTRFSSPGTRTVVRPGEPWGCRHTCCVFRSKSISAWIDALLDALRRPPHTQTPTRAHTARTELPARRITVAQRGPRRRRRCCYCCRCRRQRVLGQPQASPAVPARHAPSRRRCGATSTARQRRRHRARRRHRHRCPRL